MTRYYFEFPHVIPRPQPPGNHQFAIFDRRSPQGEDCIGIVHSAELAQQICDELNEREKQS